MIHVVCETAESHHKCAALSNPRVCDIIMIQAENLHVHSEQVHTCDRRMKINGSWLQS